MEDYKNLTDEQVREIANKCCKENGFKLLDIRGLTHPDDSYLKFVLAYDENNCEYATWLLNLSVVGLSHGHYFNHKIHSTQEREYKIALDDFQKRK